MYGGVGILKLGRLHALQIARRRGDGIPLGMDNHFVCLPLFFAPTQEISSGVRCHTHNDGHRPGDLGGVSFSNAGEVPTQPVRLAAELRRLIHRVLVA